MEQVSLKPEVEVQTSGTGDGLNVLFSKPVSFPKQLPLPPSFRLMHQEGQLSWDFAKILPPRVSDRLVMIYLLWRLFRERRHFDMIITGRYGEYFALFQGLIPFFKKRHVLLDIEWRGERKSRSFNALKKLIHRIMAKGAEKIGVFCEVEAQHYSSYYGIEPDKFLWFPYCTDLEGQNFDVREDNYIFTGGVQQRDYETLFHAVKDIPIEVKVAAPLGSIDRGLISSNMNLLGVVGRDEYYKLMARSKLVVLSLVPDLRRCPGVITYVSAMRLGKTVIVNDLKGSRSYIENGKTGILVPPRDACALRDAVRTLLVEDELRREISKNAYLHAREHFSSRRLLADLSSIERRCGIEN